MHPTIKYTTWFSQQIVGCAPHVYQNIWWNIWWLCNWNITHVLFIIICIWDKQLMKQRKTDFSHVAMFLSLSLFEAPRCYSRPCVRIDQKSWVPRRRRDTFYMWTWLYIKSSLQICMYKRGLAVNPSGNVLLWVKRLSVLLFCFWFWCYSMWTEIWGEPLWSIVNKMKKKNVSPRVKRTCLMLFNEYTI